MTKRAAMAHYTQRKNICIWSEALGDRSDPAVLLICGAGAHAHFWTDSFCNKLVEAEYYVIRFDHRDTGCSSAVDFDQEPYTVMDLAEDCVAILDSYKIGRAHIVGHSMGGAIAQILAVYHSDRIFSCTSMSSAVGEAAAPKKEVMKILLENRPTQNFEESLEGFMRSWRLLNGKIPVEEEMAKVYTKELYTRSLHPVGVAWNHIRSQCNMNNLLEKLQKSPVPILFLHGEEDPLVPAAITMDAVKAIPGSIVRIIPQMGHMIFNKELELRITNVLLQHFVAKRCI